MFPEFAQPLWLLLLLLVPLLLGWNYLRRQSSLRFPQVSALQALPAGNTRGARWGGPALRATALVLLIVGISGPRWPDPGTRIPTEGIALVMVVDVSGSMAEPDFRWDGLPMSRLDAVKKTFRLFVEGGPVAPGKTLPGRKNDLIGMVTFANDPESACPLTLSHGALLRLLDAERPRVGPELGRTNIGDALAWGLHRLKAAGDRRKVIVLLTDGEHNVPDVLKPRQSAQLAGNLQVPVYAIDVGSDQPRPDDDKGTSEADRMASKKVLQEIAKMTGGQYFQAGDARALLDVYARIDQMERRPIDTFQYRSYEEGYPWFALVAFLCLAAAVVGEMTVWRRVP